MNLMRFFGCIMEKVVHQMGDITYVMNKYQPEDMPVHWDSKDRYNQDARRMHAGCVLVKCDKETAMKISAYWANNIMAIPSATYWNGQILSICIEYARSNKEALLKALNSLQIEVYKGDE